MLRLLIIIFVTLIPESVIDAHDDNLVKEQKDPLAIAQDNNGTSVVLNLLEEIYAFSKEISYSKGPFREIKDKDSKKIDNLQPRRSLIRKASVSAESVILKELLDQFVNNTVDKKKLLNKMVDLVHEYDVAINFAKMKGLHLLIEYLSYPDKTMVSSVLSVLGAAMQGNPFVQNVAFELNLDSDLMNLLYSKVFDLYPSTLFVLSSYLRNMPKAQNRFLASGSMFILGDILKSFSVSTDSKFKIINLLSDLFMEQEAEQENFTDVQLNVKRLFKSEMDANKICIWIASLLELQDLESHYIVVSAMNILYPVCKASFNRRTVAVTLKLLLLIYSNHPYASVFYYPRYDSEQVNVVYKELVVLYDKISSVALSFQDNITMYRVISDLVKRGKEETKENHYFKDEL